MYFWHFITRLGEAQLVLPVALLAVASCARNPEARPGALRVTAFLSLAILLTAASKVAFIGWGIGSAALDFTGISGHSMFAAAVYPTLSAAVSSSSARIRPSAMMAGCVLAILVGISRVVLDAHSVSEIIAGWLVGGLVSLGAMLSELSAPPRLNVMVLAGAALWMALMPTTAPMGDSHALVTRLALELSGHQQPFTRSDLLGRLD